MATTLPTLIGNSVANAAAGSFYNGGVLEPAVPTACQPNNIARNVRFLMEDFVLVESLLTVENIAYLHTYGIPTAADPDSIAFDDNIIIARPLFNAARTAINVFTGNRTDSPLDLMYVVAVYNGLTLKDIETFEISNLTAGANNDIPLDISGMNISVGNTVKVFVWDGFNLLTPMAEITVLE